MATWNQKGYDSYSGCDIVVTARLATLNNSTKKIEEKIYTLGSIQTLSVSTHQDKKPVRVIGSMNALDYTMGQRTIAGSLVFAVFDQHFATEMFNDLKAATGKSFFLPDELPALDITITFANEYGRTSRMAIYGVRIINEGQVRLFKKYGINRVSFGIQTFNQKIGKYINRQSSFELCQEKIALLNNYGIENINADFIFGLPYQSLADVKNDLLLINSLSLKHVSYYSLILEDRSVLGYEIKRNKITLPDIDLAADMYELIQKELPKMGYSQYEISNFCKDGYESKHNKIYWELDDYYGIGMSAASYNNNKRYTNSRLINEYLNDENITNDEVYLGEFFFLGLRLTKGVSLQKFYEKYQIDPYQKYPINELIDKGLVVVIDDYLKLTPLGLDNGNLVFEAFI